MFNNEMGRYELQSNLLLPFLWIKEMTACLMVSGNDPGMKDSLYTASKIGESSEENFLKN